MSAALAIGIDVGGTNIKGGIVDANGAIVHRHEIPTRADRGPAAVMDDLAKLVAHLRGGREVVGVGLATPGPLDLRRGCIVHAANLPGWIDVPIRDALAHACGLPVTLENDANAAAYGEFTAGAGRGCQHMTLFTLGTGVGAGVIVDGQVLHGHFDNAAELGHMIVEVGGEPCPCGQRGCLERYCSADAVARRVREIKGSRRSAGGRPVDWSAERVAQAARDGDADCACVWDESCKYLAVACVNVQHAYNSQRIILGGGMSQAGEFLISSVRRHFAEQAWKLHDDLPDIVLAQLGSDAGLVGAVGLIRDQLNRIEKPACSK